MKKVITYGTFDLFHQGHVNILKRAKKLGDYLIVGVTSANYDISRGKLNVTQSLAERIENVKQSGLADEIIVEEYFGQKIIDIQKYNINIFAIGSDWVGKFDYLKKFCEVVYLPRTKGVSSTLLRNEKEQILKLGIVGNGRIAKRFVKESRYVSGIDVEYVYGRDEKHLSEFCNLLELSGYYTDYDKFLNKVDAVYIALPHVMHYEYAKKSLLAGKHVLCEKPITLSKKETEELYKIAKDNGLVIQEAIKTVYAPCFEKLMGMVQSGVIGEVRDIEATFTKLIEDSSLREFNPELGGGSLTELGSYPLSIITKLLGTNPRNIQYFSFLDDTGKIDLMTKVFLQYDNAVATANTGLRVKREGDCVIAGTKGYIYIPAPWWKIEYFEIKFEDLNKTQKVFEKFEGDGLRYELADFLKNIKHGSTAHKLHPEQSIFISSIIENFRKKS